MATGMKPTFVLIIIIIIIIIIMIIIIIIIITDTPGDLAIKDTPIIEYVQLHTSGLIFHGYNSQRSHLQPFLRVRQHECI